MHTDVMDYRIFTWIHQWAGKGSFLDTVGIFFAEWALPLTATVFLVAWIVGTVKEYPWRSTLLRALIAGGVAKGIGFLFDALLFLPRPFAALEFTPLVNADLLGSSFPSGHTSFMAALAFVLWYEANTLRAKKISYAFFGLALVVGIARIYAGVHWPSDIVGGLWNGLLAASVVQAIRLRFRSKEE